MAFEISLNDYKILSDNEDKEKNTNGNDNTLKRSTNRTKRPVPKINADTLLEDKGLLALENKMKTFIFKGRGHEVDDLRSLIQQYRIWANEMAPLFGFESVIDKLEDLGHKRPIRNAIKKLRSDGSVSTAISNEFVEEDMETKITDYNDINVNSSQLGAISYPQQAAEFFDFDAAYATQREDNEAEKNFYEEIDNADLPFADDLEFSKSAISSTATPIVINEIDEQERQRQLRKEENRRLALERLEKTMAKRKAEAEMKENLEMQKRQRAEENRQKALEKLKARQTGLF